MGVLMRSLGLVALGVVLLALTTTGAYAQDLSPIDNFFQTLGNALTGTTGRAIGFVAICGVGILFLAGRMPLMAAGSVALGLVVIYGAATILGGF